MAERPDPRRFPRFLDYYLARFAALYGNARKPRTRLEKAADIDEAEREHREAWEGGGRGARSA